MISITEQQAVGDGRTDNRSAIQKTLDLCAAGGGGTVVVPPGCFLSGPLNIGANVWLRLEPGAVLRAVPDISGWPVIPDPYSGDASERDVYQPFLYAEDVRNVGVSGRGVVDGSGSAWWKSFRQGALKYRRPRTIVFNGCTDVAVEGITVTNSPQWTINPVCCDNVRVSGVTVRNPALSPNTDGINPDSCRHVRISDCHIDVGDDCITIKSGTESSIRPSDRAACENIIIANCTMVHGHGGVVCGSEMSGSVRDVTISNCVFRGTERGLRFKSRRGRGGIIENVCMSNVQMDDVQTPFIVNLFYHCAAEGETRVTDTHAYPVDDSTPRIERLRFRHISAHNARFAAGVFHGLPEMPISDVLLHDVDVGMVPGSEQGVTAMASTIPLMANRAFFCRWVRGLVLESTRVRGHIGPFVDAVDCEGLRVDERA